MAGPEAMTHWRFLNQCLQCLDCRFNSLRNGPDLKSIKDLVVFQLSLEQRVYSLLLGKARSLDWCLSTRWFVVSDPLQGRRAFTLPLIVPRYWLPALANQLSKPITSTSLATDTNAIVSADSSRKPVWMVRHLESCLLSLNGIGETLKKAGQRLSLH